MNDTMYHRGPNDSGRRFMSGRWVPGWICAAQASIMDLSELGHQPMHSEAAFGGQGSV